jgi:hypothetical protein
VSATPTRDRLLRMRLRDGGFGLTSSVYTSPAAYIASVASARETTIFAPYGKADHPLPSDTLLHSWLADSMRLVTEATPDSASILPPSASSFFSFYTAAKSSLSSTLQRKLSLQANQHRFDASLTAAKQMRKQDGGAALAHAKAISAPLASAWKRTAPTHPLLKLRDTQFRIGARLNLGLPPFSDMRELPDSCPLCRRVDAISKDAWHFLYCSTQMPLEINTRHNAVVDCEGEHSQRVRSNEDTVKHTRSVSTKHTRSEERGSDPNSPPTKQIQWLRESRATVSLWDTGSHTANKGDTQSEPTP